MSLFLFINVVFVSADIPWLDGWTYRKMHVINAQEGAGTNYQVKITVHYGSGTDSGADVYLNEKCKTDFGDIRFTDNDQETELDCWMENKTDSDNAIFWVEVSDNLNNSDVTIYTCYGNTDAITTSNGLNTFPFFEDFLGSVVNTSDWSVVGSPSVSSSICTVATTSGIEYIQSKTSFSKPLRLRANLKWADYGDEIFSLNSASEYTRIWRSTYGGDRARIMRTATSGGSTETPRSWTFNSFINQEITWTAARVKYYSEDVHKTTHTVFVPNADMPIRFYVVSGDGNPPVQIEIDWVFIANFFDPEPSHGSWGSQETIPFSATSIAAPYAFAAISIMSLSFVIGIGAALISSWESQDFSALVLVVIVGIGITIALFIALPILNAFSGL